MRPDTNLLNIGFAIIAIAMLTRTLLAAPHAAAIFEFIGDRTSGLSVTASAADPYTSPDNIGLF